MNAKSAKKRWARQVAPTVLAAVVIALAGCKTQQMKTTPFYEGHDVTYTGAPEDRVNLWPLAYWREPVGSVLWPMFSFSDDHFAFRPLYSRYGTEHNFLWPIGQYDIASREGRIFPVLWGKHHFDVFPVVWNHDAFHSLFPLYFWKENDYMTLFPLAWWDIDGGAFTLFPVYGHGKERDWLLPLYYAGPDTTWITPLYGQNVRGDRWLLPLCYRDADGSVITPLYGQLGQEQWMFPLWYNASDEFFSWLWYGHWNSQGELDKWLVPPLLTAGGRDEHGASAKVLMGLGGTEWDGPGGFRSSWCFPLWYENSEGTLATLLYGQSKDTQWMFPVWYKDAKNFASWFWYGHWNDKDDLDRWLVPPLLTGGGRNEHGAYFKALMGLGGAEWDGPGGFRSSWCFPLWYESNQDTFVTALFGQDGDSKWILPLVYWDSLDFVTPLWWQTFNPKTGGTDSWMIPPLVTGGGVDYSGKSYFYSPLGGYSATVSGMFPLWYKDSEGFYSLPYCSTTNGSRTVQCIPPLLSWRETSQDGNTRTRGLLGMYGHTSDAKGNTLTDWLFPLYAYGYNGIPGDFFTLLIGRMTSGNSTDYWWLTPFVGTTTGETSGFWLGPLVSWKSNKNLSQLENMMNAEKMDGSIVGKVRKEQDWCPKGVVTNDVFRVEGRSAHEELQFNFETAGRKHTINMEGGDNAKHPGRWSFSAIKKEAGKLWREGKNRTVSFDEKTEFGNRLFYGGERQRVVNFDYDTKEKVFDGEVDESLSLLGLVWSSRNEKFEGHDYSKRALFWRLYHHESLNGDGTTDIFPFITRDVKKDGYTNTSFLWRFFRYENDPKKGTSLDLFFIPLMRP